MIPDEYEVEIDIGTSATVPDELKNKVKRGDISEKQAKKIVSDSVAEQIKEMFTDNLTELNIVVSDPDSD